MPNVGETGNRRGNGKESPRNSVKNFPLMKMQANLLPLVMMKAKSSSSSKSLLYDTFRHKRSFK